MLFYSFEFLALFFILVLGYYILPTKLRKYIIFVFNIGFYASFGYKPAVFVFAVATLIYLSAIIIDNKDNKKSLYLCLTCFVLVGILVALKYGSFISITLNASALLNPSSIVLPVGMSFFTFQALSYVIDVNKQKIKCEKDYIVAINYLMFFPCIISGPILRADYVIPQFKEDKKFDYDGFLDGFLLFLIGLFQKLVVADRIGIIVDKAYGDTTAYKGFVAIWIIIFYSLQIYFDFAGYSNMAIGVAKILSVNVKKNFDTPYFSQSISEFWRRWHISLSSWLKDYVYIPLGGNRKGYLRKQINILIVFLISGIWHGSTLNFVVWGLLHGVYQVIGNIISKPRIVIEKYIGLNSERIATKLLKMAVTFVLTSMAWVFFRAESVSQAVNFIIGAVKINNPWVFFDGSIYNLGLNQKNIHVLFIGLLFLLVADIIEYRGRDLVKLINSQQLIIRWGVYLMLIFAVLIFGIYGSNYDANNFIYFRF